MRIWVCGVRGSTPAPGAVFARYGGHTSCLALAHDGEAPRLVIDAGTGIRRLADLFNAGPGILGDAPFRGTILLGHLHWDHTQGLPFFAAGNHPRSQVRLLAPGQGETSLLTTLERFMSPPHFPITPGELDGTWHFAGLEPGDHEIEGFTIRAREIPHGGGRTFGYRIEDGSRSIAYLSDHCPTRLGPGPDDLGEYHESALALAHGVDLLVHDGQVRDEELTKKARFGHAACGYAVRLAEEAGARHVLLFHHDPGQRDDDLDETVARYADGAVPVSAAMEETLIDLPDNTPITPISVRSWA